jgi:hypothetical protein
LITKLHGILFTIPGALAIIVMIWALIFSTN